MARVLSLYLPAVLFLLVLVGIVVFPEPIEYITQYVERGGVSAYVMFVLLLVTATVFAPVTVMPLIPAAAAILGPLPTALLSIVGWTVGAVIAFLIARYIGRPILERFLSMQKIDTLADSLPKRHRFLTIVLLRLTLPVDIGSYALGLTKSVELVEYTIATIIGVTWFSFAFAYLGDAFLTGNMPLLIELGGLSLLIFGAGWYMLRRTREGE